MLLDHDDNHVLTLSPGSECTSGNLVSELSALLAAELLALFAGQQSLVLIHLLFILSAAGLGGALVIVVLG